MTRSLLIVWFLVVSPDVWVGRSTPLVVEGLSLALFSLVSERYVSWNSGGDLSSPLAPPLSVLLPFAR